MMKNEIRKLAMSKALENDVRVWGFDKGIKVSMQSIDLI